MKFVHIVCIRSKKLIGDFICKTDRVQMLR